MSEPHDTETVGPEESDAFPFATLEPGTAVGDRYEILQLIGTGGSAVVYAAHDRTLKRDVALKVLRADRLTKSSLIRLRREVRVARDVRSPHLVPIYDIGEDGSSAWISMELVEGTTLRSLVDGPEVSVDRALEIATQLLVALEALHEQGIVHRDVKPGNVLIDSSGSIKLTDLGLARRWESLETKVTATHHLVGTLDYISPEQALGLELDGRSDLYSFGVLLFELLTGELPHKGQSALGTLLAHVNTRPVEIRKLRSDIPAWLSTVIMRLLSKRREERYQTAAEVLHDLRTKRPDWKFALRRARLRLTIAAILVVAIAVALLSWKTWHDSRFDHVVMLHPAGIQALDRTGRTLWSISRIVNSRVVEAKLRRGEPRRLVTFLTDPMERNTDDYHVLSILDAQTGRTLRNVTLPQNHMVFGGFSNTYTVKSLSAVDLDHDGLDELVICYGHSPLWPSYSVYFDPVTGKSRTLLRASGHHKFAGAVDIDEDGFDELVFFGINNRMGSYNALAAVNVLGAEFQPTDPFGSEERDLLVASSPDAEYSTPKEDVLVWYTLLPSPVRQYGRSTFDPARRRIVIETPGEEPIVVGFDGFLVGTSSSLQPGERRRARKSAYRVLREAFRLLESGVPVRAGERLAEAAELSRAAADPMLSEWISRNMIRALIRQNRLKEADAAIDELISTASTPGDVAWDAANEYHLKGSLEKAASLYIRGVGLNTRVERGRKIYEFAEAAVLALGELGRWNDAKRVVRQFEAGYLERRLYYADHFHAYIEWRSTGRVSSMPNGEYEGPDLQRYWRLEFAALDDVDESFIGRIDRELELASGSTCLLRALRADVLSHLGRAELAEEEIESAYRDALAEREVDTAVRAHFDLVEERFRRLTGKAPDTRDTPN